MQDQYSLDKSIIQQHQRNYKAISILAVLSIELIFYVTNIVDILKGKKIQLNYKLKSSIFSK